MHEHPAAAAVYVAIVGVLLTVCATAVFVGLMQFFVLFGMEDFSVGTAVKWSLLLFSALAAHGGVMGWRRLVHNEAMTNSFMDALAILIRPAAVWMATYVVVLIVLHGLDVDDPSAWASSAGLLAVLVYVLYVLARRWQRRRART